MALHHRFLSRTALAITGLALTGPAFAANAEDDSARLAPVLIDTTRLSRALDETPAAVSHVGREDIADGRQQLQLAESLSRVPGLYFQNSDNFAQGQRISARGFGARAPFGIRGLRIRIDGIPETLPDGQSQVDALDLDSAADITVIRGPSSVLYGNASGGIIDITSRDGRDRDNDQTRILLRGEYGENGYRKINAQLSGNEREFSHHVSVTDLDYAGYREQSAVQQQRMNARIGLDLTPERHLDLVFTALNTDDAQDPGGLTRAQVRADRRQATANAVNLNAGQQVRQQRIGLLYNDKDAAGGALNARTFFTRREFVQQLPFPGSSLVSYARNFYGAGIDYTGYFNTLGLPQRYIIGAETERQEDDRLRRTVNPAGAITGISGDAFQRATAAGVFVQTDTALGDALTMTLGARADRVRLAIDDRLGNDSGARTFNEGSYSAGLLWRAHADHQLFANAGTAFETPTFTEFANPDGSGGFNPTVTPQKTRSAEVGARGALHPTLRYDIALFAIRVRDEITPYEDNGRTFYENAARTERHGLEVGLTHTTTERLTFTAAWTWASYRLERFEDRNGNDFSGNRLPGLPQHSVFLESAWRHEMGHFVIIDTRFASDVFTNNANTRNSDARAASHAVANARIGRRWQPFGQTLDIHAGVNNIFNRDYFSNIRVNANNGQYFEPGPDRMLYTGLTLSFD